jgi:DNA-binding NarL/FixJ family response regulator
LIRLVIADDHALMRSGMRVMLEAEEDIRVVGEAGDGRAAVEAVHHTTPDVLVTDVRMPEVDGIEATRRIVATGHPTRVLMITTFDLDRYVYAGLEAGASGFLLKDAQPGELVRAVRTVAAGDALLAPTVTRRLVEHFVGRPQTSPEVAAQIAELSERELSVLRQLARGLSNAEIGAELYLAEATVKSHITRLLAKLGLKSRTQAVVFAYEHGLVRRGG